MTAPAVLEGWRAIAAHLAARTRLSIAPSCAQRWASRPCNPLPVRRWGGRRPRVMAEVAELEAWADRQWIGGTAP